MLRSKQSESLVMQLLILAQEEDALDAKNVKLVNKLIVENVHSVKIW